MTWLRFKAFVLALLAFSFMAAACTSATCGWIIAIKTLQNVSGGGGGGVGFDLRAAPFLTYAENATLTHDVPVSRLNVSVKPAAASNASLTLGNSTNYFAALHALNGFFAFVGVGQQLTALNASFAGNVSITQETTILGNTHSRAYLADDVLVWDTTWTQVPYDTETFDVKNEFSTVTYNFTARKAGYYDVVAQTHLESVWNWGAIIQVNGVTQTHSFVLAAAGDIPEPIVNLMTDHYYLNAGDNVNVWVYCYGLGGGQCQVFGSSPYTYFVVEKAEA